MAKKKTTQISVSQEDNAQAQHILEQYHQIANDLHTSADQKQAEAALTEINNMPEGAQFALLKALSKDEWIDRRDAWADEADPRDLEPGFIHEREPQELGLWLPNTVSASRSTTRKEIEAGWSIELDETDSSDTLPELPQATIIYEETGRHWFWTSYTLVQEEDEWRIQSMTDEVANAQGLSIAELHRRIQEHDEYLNEFTQKQKQKPADTVEAEQYLD